MRWKLIDKTIDAFCTGTFFRCPASYPYESIVDFMLIRAYESPSEFALLVATGAKAGNILIQLPEEALVDPSRAKAISGSWIYENWQKWVYELGPEGVSYASNYLVDGVKWTLCFRPAVRA